MDSIILLQQIDCNCNDCKFMVRDVDRFKKSLEFHKKLQYAAFEGKKNGIIAKAEYYKREKGDLDKWQNLHDEGNKMKFQFDKKDAILNYGTCSKLNKEVSFIPGRCQINTQQCFEHRKV